MSRTRAALEQSVQEARMIGFLRPEVETLIDFYTGINFEVAEIETLAEHLASYARDLRAMHTQKYPVNVKLCADSIAQKAKQMAILSEHLSKITKLHINRKPRNGSAA